MTFIFHIAGLDEKKKDTVPRPKKKKQQPKLS